MRQLLLRLFPRGWPSCLLQGPWPPVRSRCLMLDHRVHITPALGWLGRDWHSTCLAAQSGLGFCVDLGLQDIPLLSSAICPDHPGGLFLLATLPECHPGDASLFGCFCPLSHQRLVSGAPWPGPPCHTPGRPCPGPRPSGDAWF